MLLWHVGGTLLGFRYVFRDPKVDVRFLALGAVISNLIDKPLWLATGLPPRSLGHTLIVPMILMAGILLTTRRGRRRRRWMVLPIGMGIHLVLDGMWAQQEILLWPFFGFEFPSSSTTLSSYLSELLANPWTWAKEAAGLAYLVYLGNKIHLGDPAVRRQLLSTGRLSA